MAKVDSQSIGVPLNPLMREETNTYVAQQKRADYFKNISQYLFWGATTIAGALAIGLVTGGLGGLALAGGSISGTTTLIAGAIASVATFFGSVAFSNRATELSEKSAVLYSDIDSQNQAHRMVQAFAKAQSTEQAVQSDVPFEAPQSSWVEKTGKAQNIKTQGGWAERVAAEAHLEDAHALAQLRGGRH